MTRFLCHAAIGLIFGAGLILSGMANPQKVLSFLNIGGYASGQWDPSLAFVMAGAIAVAAPGFLLVLRRPKPVLDDAFALPAQTGIDRRLILGAAIFGVGWGLAGLCPGPAFVALTIGGGPAAIFMVTMLVGMAAGRAISQRG